MVWIMKRILDGIKGEIVDRFDVVLQIMIGTRMKDRSRRTVLSWI